MAAAPPSTSKEAAEIGLIQAQIARLEYEQRPAPLAALSDVIKLVGSLIPGLGGVTAAVTGYQISEIKTERTNKRKSELEQTRAVVQRSSELQKVEREPRCPAQAQEIRVSPDI